MQQRDKLTDAEFKQMIQLIHRYISTEMDQWEAWKLNTTYGDVFISMSYCADGSEQFYTDLSKVLD